MRLRPGHTPLSEASSSPPVDHDVLGLRCPLCHDDLAAKRERVRRCGACHTAYHDNCSSELGGCAVLGCPRLGLMPTLVNTAMAIDPDQIAARRAVAGTWWAGPAPAYVDRSVLEPRQLTNASMAPTDLVRVLSAPTDLALESPAAVAGEVPQRPYRARPANGVDAGAFLLWAFSAIGAVAGLGLLAGAGTGIGPEALPALFIGGTFGMLVGATLGEVRAQLRRAESNTTTTDPR
ncbi:hypothetical protein OAX78_01590 [Planctomycetota bacterium]|nr:hypothetical protein [Planctomycetota bacterium]